MSEKLWKCKHAGKEVKDRAGNEYACKYCDGLLKKEGKHLELVNPIRMMFSLPRSAMVGFNCPALLVAFDDQGNLTDEVRKEVEE